MNIHTIFGNLYHVQMVEGRKTFGMKRVWYIKDLIVADARYNIIIIMHVHTQHIPSAKFCSGNITFYMDKIFIINCSWAIIRQINSILLIFKL